MLTQVVDEKLRGFLMLFEVVLSVIAIRIRDAFDSRGIVIAVSASRSVHVSLDLDQLPSRAPAASAMRCSAA